MRRGRQSQNCDTKSSHLNEKRAGAEAAARSVGQLPGLGGLDVGGLLALRALGDFEGDLLAFLQRLEAIHVDGREVREQVFAAAVRGDEAEALRVIEPFYDASCHNACLSKKMLI